MQSISCSPSWPDYLWRQADNQDTAANRFRRSVSEAKVLPCLQLQRDFWRPIREIRCVSLLEERISLCLADDKNIMFRGKSNDNVEFSRHRDESYIHFLLTPQSDQERFRSFALLEVSDAEETVKIIKLNSIPRGRGYGALLLFLIAIYAKQGNMQRCIVLDALPVSHGFYQYMGFTSISGASEVPQRLVSLKISTYQLLKNSRRHVQHFDICSDISNL